MKAYRRFRVRRDAGIQAPPDELDIALIAGPQLELGDEVIAMSAPPKHLLELGEKGWALEHPQECHDTSLLDCPLHALVAEWATGIDVENVEFGHFWIEATDSEEESGFIPGLSITTAEEEQ